MKCDIVSVLLFVFLLVGVASGAALCFESQSGNFLSADSSWTVSSSPTCGDMERWHQCNFGSYYGIWHIESSFSPEPRTNPHVFLGDSNSDLELIERSKFGLHTDQKWIPEENGDGTVSYRNKDSDLYLTAGSNGYAGLSNEVGPDQKFLVHV